MIVSIPRADAMESHSCIPSGSPSETHKKTKKDQAQAMLETKSTFKVYTRSLNS